MPRSDSRIIAAAADLGASFATPCDGEAKISAALAPEVPSQQYKASTNAPVADGGTAAKLDNPDAQGGKMEPGPSGHGHKIEGKDGKAPLPTFILAAYNGGPMKLAGFNFPVVINASGAEFASNPLPIHAGGHLAENASPAETMESLAGMGMCDGNDGKITSKGEITGDTPTVRALMTHVRNGVKFQNSVYGRPIGDMDFLRAGESEIINGRTISGPVLVARRSLITHISILPLGADVTTSARIAAQHAAGADDMEWTAWLKANYGIDQTAFGAMPKAAQDTIKASFDAAGKEPEKKLVKEPVIAAAAASDPDAVIKAQNAALAGNMARVAKINEIAKDHPAIAASAIGEGWTVEKTENAVLKAQRDDLTLKSLGSINGNTGNAARIAASKPRVIEAATLLSCGYPSSRLENDRDYGKDVLNMTDDFARMERSRVVTPSKLARIIARNAGVQLPDGHGDDFWSDALANERVCPRGGERIVAGYGTMAAEFSTVSLPVALSNVMNKFVLMGYTSVDPNACEPNQNIQAWKNVCRVSSVNDFKPHYRYRMVASVLLQHLLKGGEIQHGSIGEQSYMLAADTKAVILGLTRKDLINDDQSVLSTLPTHFGVGSGRTVANDIWDCWLAGLQSDGITSFYTSIAITTPGSLMQANQTSGAALMFASLEAAHLRMAAQTDPTGQPAGLLGQVLLVPVPLAGTALQINSSERIPTYATTRAAAVGDANTMRGRQTCVASAYLANGTLKPDGTKRAGSASNWWLSAFASDTAYPIEIGFLNGVETPIIERAEADFSRLGIQFRTFLDYGVSMSEPRSVQMQTT